MYMVYIYINIFFLSPFQGWGTLTMSLLVNLYLYLPHRFILIWFNPFDHRVNRVGWCFELCVIVAGLLVSRGR